MQIYALENGRLVAAPYAEKRKNYTCPECRASVRVRGGDIRQSHYFHLQGKSTCRLSQKGAIHLRLQKFVHYLFENEAEMEMPFPEIGRIADVACPRSKKIFEIQYSPITLEEARQRCIDYESLGYSMIWILHDHTFNEAKVGPAELYLRTKVCYFTNMDEEGNGTIYDVFDEVRGKKRTSLENGFRSVDLRISKSLPPFRWPRQLIYRAGTWPFYHEGDCLDAALKNLLRARQANQSFFERFKDLYMGILHMLLERSSK